jgi:hypothetical protein
MVVCPKLTPIITPISSSSLDKNAIKATLVSFIFGRIPTTFEVFKESSRSGLATYFFFFRTWVDSVVMMEVVGEMGSSGTVPSGPA